MKTLLMAVAALSAAAALSAEPRRGQEKTLRSIEPVNVEVPFMVVEGTVTVRLRGVPVNPRDVVYAFEPGFPSGRGYLSELGDGRYRLKLTKVPANRSYTLTVRTAYNDAEVRDGVVIKRGTTSSGVLRLDIPAGADHSFGERLLDLY